MSGLWQAFRDAGLLPARAGEEPSIPSPEWGDDTLDVLLAIWRSSAGVCRGSAARSRERVVERLEQWRAHGARLTWGVPGASATVGKAWLGVRLAWWPNGVPRGRRIGLVSSRLGGDLGHRQSWFAALRTACLHLDVRHDLLLTARSITTQRFVRRAAELFGIRVVEITVGNEQKRASCHRWGQCVLARDPEGQESIPQVWLSPASSSLQPPEQSLVKLPVADRVVFALSERLIVLSARAQGNVARLVAHRLAAGNFPSASVYLALGPDLVAPRLAVPWMASGAVGWHLRAVPPADGGWIQPPWNMVRSRNRSAPIRKIPRRPDWSLLTHWTRQPSGPWPDQSADDYLDDLILDRGGVDHSALAALCRIVRTRELIATGTLIRGGVRMVCFTEVSLEELPRLRSFRSHLSRWDFEWYGICIDRTWIAARGGRPVRYGERDEWILLSAEERPYFQPRFSRTRGGRIIDWSIEREWRHAGDLSLDQLPAEAALVFVPEVGEARKIAPISPWPVIVLQPGASRY